MDKFENLGDLEPRFTKHINPNIEPLQRALTIHRYYQNTAGQFAEGSPVFILELNDGEEFAEITKTPLPYAGEFATMLDNDVIVTVLPHLNSKHNHKYMTASTSKLAIFNALFGSVGFKLAKNVAEVEDFRFLPDGRVISPKLQAELEDVLAEAREEDRVNFDEARKEVERQLKESGRTYEGIDIEAMTALHIEQHTLHPLSFSALVWLVLHYSTNLALRFLRHYLAEVIYGPDATPQAKDEADNARLNLMQALLTAENPGYELLRGNIWEEENPNVGSLEGMVTGFGNFVTNTLRMQRMSTNAIDQILVAALRNNPRDVKFWNDQMNNDVREIVERVLGIKVRDLYVKTGDYPAIRYVKSLAEEGDPCHQIITVLLSIELEDGEIITVGMYQKYTSRIMADIDSMNVPAHEKALVAAKESTYLNGYLNACSQDFKVRFLAALETHLERINL